ncbi:MAG: ion channel, partial [Chitinophagales bacterium]
MAHRLKPSAKEDNDTGLSTKVQARNQRAIKNDGSFNIEYRGLNWFRPSDIYLELITMPLMKFNIIVFIAFITANSIFAFVYFLIGVQHLTAYEGHTKLDEFLHAFFFSAQSLTTVGYGRIAPVGTFISFVATFESMMGILTFALATGLLYGRFSKPNAKLVHSKNMLMSPYKEGMGLMFRIANGRKTQLAEVEVQVTLSKIIVEKGKDVRRFYPLDLERSKVGMFPLSWTVVHPVTPDSLLFGHTKEMMEDEDVELMVFFKAYDETFSQNVHYRISYRASDLIWGAKFIINFESQQD